MCRLPAHFWNVAPQTAHFGDFLNYLFEKIAKSVFFLLNSLNQCLANDIFLRILFMKITISNFSTSTSSPQRLEMHTAANMFAAIRAVLVLVRSNKYIS